MMDPNQQSALIRRKFNDFMKKSSDNDLIVMQKSEAFVIIPKAQKPFMDFNGWQDYEMSGRNFQASIETSQGNEDQNECDHVDADEIILCCNETTQVYQIPDFEAPFEEHQFSLIDDPRNDIQNDPDIAPLDVEKWKRKRKTFEEMNEAKTLRRKNLKRKASIALMAEYSRKDSETFLCIICNKKLSYSLSGIKIHIAKVHWEAALKLNSYKNAPTKVPTK